MPATATSRPTSATGSSASTATTTATTTTPLPTFLTGLPVRLQLTTGARLAGAVFAYATASNTLTLLRAFLDFAQNEVDFLLIICKFL